MLNCDELNEEFTRFSKTKFCDNMMMVVVVMIINNNNT
jgi:hypothetical protein